MGEESVKQSFALGILNDVQENDRICHTLTTQSLQCENLIFHSDENRDQSVKSNVEQIVEENEKNQTSNFIQTHVDRIKQIKLAKQHIILIILDLLLLLSLPLIHVICQSSSAPLSDNNEKILVIKKGKPYGGPGGEAVKDDAQKADLKFNDHIQSITACQTNDLEGKLTLLSLLFMYSNKRFGEQFGGINPSESSTCFQSFQLTSDEFINKIVVYEDYRYIANLWRMNKSTYLVVGVSFQTNFGQQILFGSSEGIANKETPKNYYLAYVQGKAGGFIDSLRFIWYKICLKNSSMSDEN